jgi:predicted house-cleaning noncanonical NTP pyrophosphatase (MazG superfamily)
MNDYIIFDEALRDRFIAFLAARGVQCSYKPDTIEGFVVTLAEELPEEIEDAIEDEYEALMTEQQDLVESGGTGDAPSLMSVEVGLKDGRSLTVHIPALYARRLHENFNVDEIRGLVSFIAQSAVDPATGPACCQS